MKQGLGDTRAPHYNTRVAPVVLSRMNCQDVIRPLELNWKNVGELCNYNHNLCSGLHYCNANARQGGGENKVKGQQKGAVFTFNINQESGAGTGKVQEIKQSPLRHGMDVRGVPSAATSALGDKVVVNRLHNAKYRPSDNHGTWTVV